MDKLKFYNLKFKLTLNGLLCKGNDYLNAHFRVFREFMV